MNISFPSFGRKSTLGLDIGSSSVKAVELNVKSAEKGFELKGLGVASMPPESIVQGAFLNSGAIVDTIQEAVELGQIETKDVVAAVSGLSVIVKKVSLPVMSRDELADQIQWEAEQYIPFDVNEVNLDFQILDGDPVEDQMEVLLVAAKKDLIDDYVHVISEAGLRPIAIDIASFAVENAHELNYEADAEGVTALVNVGAQVVNINVVQDGIPAFTRDITTGGSQYTEQIQKALSISFDEAERLKRGGPVGEESQDLVPQEVEHAIRSMTDSLVGEISRSLDFFTATSVESRIQRVMVCGGGSQMSGFVETFRERTGFEVEALDPLAKMIPSKKFDSEFLHQVAPSLGVGVGLATRRIQH